MIDIKNNHPDITDEMWIKIENKTELVEEHFIKGRPLEKLFFKDSKTKKKIKKMNDIPFFSNQMCWVMRNKGFVDPENIDKYISRDGYFTAAKALNEMKSDEIINEMIISGLRGHGGGGFPAGMKWKFAVGSQGLIKYVFYNADEGDPGASMDRSILEADPHAVLEGMIIAARAINSRKGYIYCCSEYPLAIKRPEITIRQAENYGLLGDDILGSDLAFNVEIYQEAGAFVCGEETALMRSIEGKREMPRPRSPFPAQKETYNKSTILNNVETYANVPQIILNGGSWYSSVGTETSKGTKVFALSGDINNIGLVEVPMATSLKKIIYEIGGEIPNKGKFKAVQLGGPSGGCVPEKHIDTIIDYEEIIKVGTIMGSGGAIVMDDKTCMVDMAHFFMEFVQDEFCGKCTPCREGTRRILEIIKKICDGNGEEGDIKELEQLSIVIKNASLCRLGQTEPNPVLSTLRYFRDEYYAHIYEKKCPAKCCTALLNFEIDPDICTQWRFCFKSCPSDAIILKKKEVAVIDKGKCTKCKSCFAKCKFDAIS